MQQQSPVYFHSWRAGLVIGPLLLLASLDAAAADPALPAPTRNPPATLHYEAVVVDSATGKEIAGATVVVQRYQNTAQAQRLLAETKHSTDRFGKYTFEIPPEQVANPSLYLQFDVDHPDYVPRSGIGYSLSMIRKNETLGDKPFFSRMELRPADSVSGKLLLPDGKPAAGVKVRGYSSLNPADVREYGATTDAISATDGSFQLKLVKGGVGLVWTLPQEYAIGVHPLGKRRGDLGELRLSPGGRCQGEVLSAEGKPLAGVAVNIAPRDTTNAEGLPVGAWTRRSTLTDKQGQFKLSPLPPGDYEVTVAEYRRDPIVTDPERYSIPAPFVAQRVELKSSNAPKVILQALPHVVFRAQYVDSQGKKTKGHEIFVLGLLNGQLWQTTARPNGEGYAEARVPHGLQEARVRLLTNEHSALRYRLKRDDRPKNLPGDSSVVLGTLDEDPGLLEVVRYRSPVLVISACDEQQQPIQEFQIAAVYQENSSVRWSQVGDQYVSDVGFERQTDGRYRSSQLLPGEKVKLDIGAKGFETVSQLHTFEEGKQQEIAVTLKRSAKPSKE